MTIKSFCFYHGKMKINQWKRLIKKQGLQKYESQILAFACDYDLIDNKNNYQFTNLVNI